MFIGYIGLNILDNGHTYFCNYFDVKAVLVITFRMINCVLYIDNFTSLNLKYFFYFGQFVISLMERIRVDVWYIRSENQAYY